MRSSATQVANHVSSIRTVLRKTEKQVNRPCCVASFLIDESFYGQAKDKKQAIMNLLELRGPDATLKASGYGERFGK